MSDSVFSFQCQAIVSIFSKLSLSSTYVSHFYSLFFIAVYSLLMLALSLRIRTEHNINGGEKGMQMQIVINLRKRHKLGGNE